MSKKTIESLAGVFITLLLLGSFNGAPLINVLVKNGYVASVMQIWMIIAAFQCLTGRTAVYVTLYRYLLSKFR